jgi:RNA polymerase sigma-B factor
MFSGQFRGVAAIEGADSTLGTPPGRPLAGADQSEPMRGSRSVTTEATDQPVVWSADVRRLHRQYVETRDGLVRDELVRIYAGLVRTLARRFAHRGETLDDLTQVAFIGLLKALDRFEPERNHPFVTYAVPTIVGELKRHFRDSRWSFRVPRSLQERYLYVREVRDTIEQELRHVPSVRELAEYTGLGEDEVVEAMEARNGFHVVSLDRLVFESTDSAGTLGRCDADLGAVESRQLVRALLSQLQKREQQVLWMRFFQNMTQQEIAHVLRTNQMSVSRILRRSLTRMKTFTEAEEQRRG